MMLSKHVLSHSRRFVTRRSYQVCGSHIRRYATSPDDYEIDLISLKRTRKHSNQSQDISKNGQVPKKASPKPILRYSDAKQGLDVPTLSLFDLFEELSYSKSFDSDPISDEVVKSSILSVKSHYDKSVPIEEKSFRKTDDEGYLEFVMTYQRELDVFLQFIIDSYNSKITKFSQLTSLEVLNALYIFKNYYQNNKIKDVTKYNFASYNVMFERLTNYLTYDPELPTLLTEELVPFVNDFECLAGLYRNGIGNYLSELNALSQEFDLGKLQTFGRLSDEINRTLSQFNDYLHNNQISTVDTTFFRILIQINRYKSLKTILDASPNTDIRHLISILKDKDSHRINEAIKDKSGITHSLKSFLYNLTPYYQLLRCHNGMEITNYESFIDSTPTLYSATGLAFKEKSGQNTILSDASLKVLKGCLSVFNSGLISIEDSGQQLKFLTADNAFGKSDLVKIGIEDPIQNYDVSMFYYSKLFEYLDTLRLLRLFSGKSYAETNLDELNELLESYLSDKSSARFSEDIFNIDPCLSWYAFYVPWSHGSLKVFDQIIDNRAWITGLASINEKRIINNYSAADLEEKVSGMFKPSQISILKGFQDWLGGHKFENFNSVHLSELFEQFKGENEYAISTIFPSKECEELSTVLKKYSHISYFCDYLDSFVLGSAPTSSPSDITVSTIKSELERFNKELAFFRNEVLKQKYQSLSYSKIVKKLDNFIERSFDGSTQIIGEEKVFDFIRLKKKLAALNLNEANLRVLDSIVNDHPLVEETSINSEAKSSDYVQIPEDLELHRFYKELEILRDDELKKPFKESSVQQIQSLLSARIDELYDDSTKNSNPNSRLTRENVLDFLKLSRRLARLFEINGGNVEVLDTLIYNRQVFEDVDKKISQAIPKPYLQIPEDLELHKFTYQLQVLRDDELKKPFGEFTASELNSILDKRIDETIRDESSNPGSRLTKENADSFIRLSKRLTRLLDYNGGYTSVLDTLIHSQNVFEEFEKTKKKLKTTSQETAPLTYQESDLPYKQVPDDFFLEEYVTELIQVRSNLGSEFKSVSSKEILEEINRMAEKEDKSEKQLSWRKLYRNLVILFKHNNNNTFVLDSIITNFEVFLKFESNKTFDVVSKKLECSIIGENSKLINNYFEFIEAFLKKVDLLGKDGIWKLTDNQFEDLLNTFKESLDPKAYEYPIYVNLINELKQFNSKIEYYPNFLQQLYEIKSNNSDKALSTFDVEVIYKAFIENIEYETRQEREQATESEVRTRVYVPFEEPKNKFDMDEFIGEIKTIKRDKATETERDATGAPIYKKVEDDFEIEDKPQYNDSEKLLSLLTKDEEPVDFANNDVLKHRFAQEEDSLQEMDIRDAVSTALSGSKHQEPVKASKPETSNHQDRSPHRIKEKFAVNEQPTAVDKTSLEAFLKRAKKEKDLAEEEKKRASIAYEWSKNTSHFDSSLEDHDFDVQSHIPKQDNFSENVLFPGTSSQSNKSDLLWDKELKDSQYLLLNIDGQTIAVEYGSIGKIPQEDIFKILNKFDKSELSRFIKHFKKLQRKNWKLIGSKIENDKKYLILKRPNVSKASTVLKTIKSIFATTGVILASLVAINLWLDGGEIQPPSTEKKIEPEKVSETNLDYAKSNADVVQEETQASFLSKLLWSSK